MKCAIGCETKHLQAIPILATALLAILVTVRAFAQVPPQRDILSATIEEVPPIDGSNVPGRQVILRIEMAGALPNPCGPSFQAYGFLIDADMNMATGLTDPAFAGLGVDARISAGCNTGTGTFEGPQGSTVRIAGPSANIIEILTTVNRLPSLRFNWVAFAQDGIVLTRLPKEPDHGAWGTTEIREW